MYSVTAATFEQWRVQARRLLQAAVPPQEVQWLGEPQQSLFDAQLQLPAATAVDLRICADFLKIAARVACFRHSKRWALLYRVAWRLLYENRHLLNVKTDPDICSLRSMYRAVSRDMHKMKAFVRFTRLDTTNAEGGECYVAWFEPKHLITNSLAPFFVERFTGMNWSILTPDACLHWNQESLQTTAGVEKPGKVEDSLEDLWRTYYLSIFNPARPKLAAMRAQMPVYYWKNLPEAQLIEPLSRLAPVRVEQMLAAAPTDANRLRNRSRGLRASQDKHRHRLD